jgi:hypothetical protein
VRDVNAGDVLPIAHDATRPLTRDALLDEARAMLGVDGRALDGFVPDGFAARGVGDAFVEPLDVLCDALETEAELTVLGRWTTRRFLLRILEVRAHVVAYLARDPGVVDEEIDAVFITGAPRTGTTVLHALLALQPGVRVPEGWELLRPVPPPDPACFPDPARVALADEELRRPALVVSGLDAIHAYSGRMPKECVSAMSFALRSEEFTARYHVPSYAAWLGSCDMRPAYGWHRLVLQILQRRFRGSHWVLKSPVHLHSLPVLHDRYPAAPIVFTHRDPLAVLASVTSLVATMRSACSDAVDFADIGRYHVDLYARSLDRLVDLDRAHDPALGRARHMHYAAFMADPVETTAAVAAALGRPVDGATADAMRAYLSAHPQGAHGVHRYSFDDLGLDRAATRARFARYQEHYAVPDEEVP